MLFLSVNVPTITVKYTTINANVMKWVIQTQSDKTFCQKNLHTKIANHKLK